MTTNIKPQIKIGSNQDKRETEYEESLRILSDTTPLTEEEIKFITQARLGYALVDFFASPNNLSQRIGFILPSLQSVVTIIRIQEDHAKAVKIFQSEFFIKIRTTVMKAILENALPTGFWRKLIADCKRYYRNDPNIIIARFANPDYRYNFIEDNYSVLTREETRELKRLREEQTRVMKGEIKGLVTVNSQKPNPFADYLKLSGTSCHSLLLHFVEGL